MSRSFYRRVRERVRTEQDSWLFAAAFCAVLFAGLVAFALAGDISVSRELVQALVLAALALAAFAPLAVRRFVWHTIANHISVAPPYAIAQPRVVDGDTIDDLATGVRYRLANIDAPETGGNAKCFKERERGETATAEAIRLVRAAKRVEVRRTFRTDIYSRRVAFVLIDGLDLGELLVRRGLARPWRGQRRKWCGKNGGLAIMAREGAAPQACSTCKSWT